MAAKTEASSPTKLSPSERLARKRAAARMRQQRCRARKRQAMLEQRRLENEATQSPSHDSRTRTFHDETLHAPQVSMIHSSSTSPSPSEKETWRSRTSNEPITNCVSFDSQRSYEEAQKCQERLPSATQVLNNKTEKSIETKPSEVISEKPISGLVSEEEAAVAAMLSLKTGPTTKPATPPSTPAQEPRPRVIETRKPHMAKYRYYGGWESRRYEAYEYPRPPVGVPDYYSRPRPPVAPMHYRYYPTFQRYGRYDYE